MFGQSLSTSKEREYRGILYTIFPYPDVASSLDPHSWHVKKCSLHVSILASLAIIPSGGIQSKERRLPIRKTIPHLLLQYSKRTQPIDPPALLVSIFNFTNKSWRAHHALNLFPNIYTGIASRQRNSDVPPNTNMICSGPESATCPC
jgi:hypothetical protein